MRAIIGQRMKTAYAVSACKKILAASAIIALPCAVPVAAVETKGSLTADGRPLSVDSPPAPNSVLPATGNSAKSAPEVTILRPLEGETFKDTPIVLQLKVANFQLQPPSPYFGPPQQPALGHLHVFLDDYPEIATSATELMFGKKDANGYLNPGMHTIAVEVVHDNHETLNPRVWKRVNFYVTH